jgi:hypothetical protein
MSDTSTSEPTTICFRNIPNFYNRAMVLELVNSNGFEGTYDFVYVPHSFKRLPVLVTLGYFFVNFASHEVALRAWERFAGFKDWVKHSDKIMDATWASNTQGQKACSERFQNSRVMNNSVPSECKPALFEIADTIESSASPDKDADAKSEHDWTSSASTVMTDGSDSETDVPSSDSAVDTDEEEDWRPRRCKKASSVVPSLEHCGFVEQGMEHSIVLKNTFIDVEETPVINQRRTRCHSCFV